MATLQTPCFHYNRQKFLEWFGWPIRLSLYLPGKRLPSAFEDYDKKFVIRS